MASRNKTSPDLLKRLKKDVVLGAEGYLFELERRGYIKAGPYVPTVVLDHPEAVKQLHREFLRAGSEVIVAFTYYGHRAKMRAIGKEDLLEDLNRQALRLATEIAAEGNALVAGNLSNTWEYDHTKHRQTEKIVRPMFAEQVQWAVEEGADFIIAETFSHLGEAMIALDAIKQAGLPSVITFAATQKNKTYDGYPYAQACRELSLAGCDVVGLNCSRGPKTILPILKKIRAAIPSDRYVAAQPVPYRTTPKRPIMQNLKPKGYEQHTYIALDPFVLTRFEMAEFAIQAKNMGINYIGICCGGAPHHVRSMAEALGRKPPASENSPDLSLHPVVGRKGKQKAKFNQIVGDFKK